MLDQVHRKAKKLSQNATINLLVIVINLKNSAYELLTYPRKKLICFI